MRATILLVVLFAACTDAAPEPSATVLSAAPESLFLGDDTRNDSTITISYADGDGDLGRGLAHVHDCRADGVVTGSHAPLDRFRRGRPGRRRRHRRLALLVNDIGAVAPAAAAPTACADLGAPAPTAGEVVFCIILTDVGGSSGPGDCTAPVQLAQP